MNDLVTDRIKGNSVFWCAVKIRRDKMIGYLQCCDSLSKSAIEGYDAKGRIRRGRPWMEYMKQITIDMKKTSYMELKKHSDNWDAWRSEKNQSKD